MTNGRPKKRGRPRKIKPVPVGDYSPKRVKPVKKWYQKVWGWIKPKEEVRVIKNEADQFLYDTEIFYKRVLRMCLQYFSMGAILAVLFVFALGEPTFISPVNSERGMERGYRIVPISHPEVAYAKEEVEVIETDVHQIIKDASDRYGVSYNLMYSIAKCESGFNPSVKNRHSSATGLYQYIKDTWIRYTNKRGLDWTLEDRKDAWKSADMTAYIISKGGIGNWDASKHCWSQLIK